MASTPMENEKGFRDWLRAQVKQDGMRLYSDNEISAYCYALKQGISVLPCVPLNNLFVISDHANFGEKVNNIKMIPEFDDLDKEDHGTYSAAFELYQYYLEHGHRSNAPDVHARFYLTREKDKQVDKSEKKKAAPVEAYHYQEVRMKCIQKVFYGAPGTGKSHSVNTLLSKAYPEDDKLRNHIKRVIFHPAYTYGEFVGAIKPVSSPDRPVEYTFVAGPFTELLKAAFLNPEDKFFLVIEEINRGNAPSIFGDIFQLLDRGPDGKSSYSIVNRDIGGFFSKDPWMKNIFYDGRIWLPANFNILATMNTADDNIFVMDSAFKRRFELEYVPINYNILPQIMRDERELFKGDTPLDELFSDTSTIVGSYAQKLKERGTLKRNWPTFAALINDAIDRENLEMKREKRANDKLIAENKKLGPYFIREHELEDRITFMNKVVFYLKQDVFTESYRFFTESFEDIFEKYSDPDSDIFEMLLEAEYDENGALIRRSSAKKAVAAKTSNAAKPSDETKVETASAKDDETIHIDPVKPNPIFEKVGAETTEEAVAEDAAQKDSDAAEDKVAESKTAEDKSAAESKADEAKTAEAKTAEGKSAAESKTEEAAPAAEAKAADKPKVGGTPKLSAEEAAALKAALGITSSTNLNASEAPANASTGAAPAESAKEANTPMSDADRASFYAAPDASSYDKRENPSSGNFGGTAATLEDAFSAFGQPGFGAGKSKSKIEVTNDSTGAFSSSLTGASGTSKYNSSPSDLYQNAGLSRSYSGSRSLNIQHGNYYDSNGNLAGGTEAKETFPQFGREMEPDNFSQDFF